MTSILLHPLYTIAHSHPGVVGEVQSFSSRTYVESDVTVPCKLLHEIKVVSLRWIFMKLSIFSVYTSCVVLFHSQDLRKHKQNEKKYINFHLNINRTSFYRLYFYNIAVDLLAEEKKNIKWKK